MRTIDSLLDFVKQMEGLSDTEKEVLRHRIDKAPTQEELNAARLKLYPAGVNSGWADIVHPAVVEAVRIYPGMPLHHRDR